MAELILYSVGNSMADKYDREKIMEQICQLMAEGQSLRRICAAVKGMPKHSTVCSWLVEDSALADQYARARGLLADYRFDEYRDAAETIVQQKLREGWEPKDAIAFARLETGNMQWEISKLAPKKYGDKIEQTFQNPDGSKLDLTVNFVTPTNNG